MGIGYGGGQMVGRQFGLTTGADTQTMPARDRATDKECTMRYLGICLATMMAARAFAAPGDADMGRCQPGEGDVPSYTAFLPPVVPWEGNRHNPAVPPDDPWATPFERSHFTDTPSYDETVRWLRKLADTSPDLQVVSIGTSARGRDIIAVVASRDHAFTPEAMRRTGKPLVFAQAGIHAGEIAGKDAGMMLLRDLVFTRKKRLLKRVSFLFIPILNVDGHERRSACNRVNQRGPRSMGWRTNGRNLNLNRDYSKLETPEVRAVVRALHAWEPDLYLDIHVTDGIDYQYDITFGFTGANGSSPAVSRWLEETLTPTLNRDLEAENHIPGPLIFAANGRDYSDGLVAWTAPPRFSHGYGDAVHIPTVLVETHSLKPFEQRVFGTYVLLESVLRLVGESGDALKQAIAQDLARRPDSLALSWRPSEGPPRQVPFKAVAYEEVPARIAGGTWIRWLGKPITVTVPLKVFDHPEDIVTVPAGYWIPPDWPEVIHTLSAHGVRMDRLEAPRDVAVEMYRLSNPKLATSPLEGRVRVTAETAVEHRVERMPAGAAWVPTDQPLGELVVMLLEPAGPDSFFQWGYFLEVLQRTEYFEPYVLEPLAEAMADANPALNEAFQRAIHNDETLSKDPRARLDWFYRRSPYVDSRWMLYPVARVPRQDAESPEISPR